MEVAEAVTAEWPWPWNPDIHWFHQYLNLSSETPEIWNALHLGFLHSLQKYNISSVLYKWSAHAPPDYIALNELHKKEYAGTGKSLFVCYPYLLGRYPDWISWLDKRNCFNYTPALTAHLYLTKEWGYVYNRAKPFVDINIGIGTAVTVLGVPGKISLEKRIYSYYLNNLSA